MSAVELEREIHRCSKCTTLRGDRQVDLNGKKIPSDFGESPKQVEILFIAESPSTTGVYFYNIDTNSNLRYKLFDLLFEAGLMEKKSLDEFKQRNYYLVDTVKCPFADIRGNNATPPNLAIENCRSFLMQEISMRKPKVVCTLGKSSLKPFIMSRNFKLSRYVGKVLAEMYLKDDLPFSNTPIFVSWFPAAMVRWTDKVGAIKGLRNLVY